MSKDGFTWYQPNSLEELLKLKSAYPNGRLISGNTEIGVEMKFRFIEAPMAINIKQVRKILSKNIVSFPKSIHGTGVYDKRFLKSAKFGFLILHDRSLNPLNVKCCLYQ